MAAPNYKEETVTGNQWQRAYRVVIENPYNKPSSIVFEEEKAVQLADQVITQPCASLVATFNLAQQFPLLDPVTGLDTGETRTHADVYALLNSLYMSLATARDAAQQV